MAHAGPDPTTGDEVHREEEAPAGGRPLQHDEPARQARKAGAIAARP